VSSYQAPVSSYQAAGPRPYASSYNSYSAQVSPRYASTGYQPAYGTGYNTGYSTGYGRTRHTDDDVKKDVTFAGGGAAVGAVVGGLVAGPVGLAAGLLLGGGAGAVAAHSSHEQDHLRTTAATQNYLSAPYASRAPAYTSAYQPQPNVQRTNVITLADQGYLPPEPIHHPPATSMGLGSAYHSASFAPGPATTGLVTPIGSGGYTSNYGSRAPQSYGGLTTMPPRSSYGAGAPASGHYGGFAPMPMASGYNSGYNTSRLSTGGFNSARSAGGADLWA